MYERERESIETGILSIGREWDKSMCRCDVSVGVYPCHYCAEHGALLAGERLLSEVVKLKEQLTSIREKLKEIVIPDGDDSGVILVSWDSPTHYDEELDAHVYEHEHFSPLGDALVELYQMTELKDA